MRQDQNNAKLVLLSQMDASLPEINHWIMGNLRQFFAKTVQIWSFYVSWFSDFGHKHRLNSERCSSQLNIVKYCPNSVSSNVSFAEIVNLVWNCMALK